MEVQSYRLTFHRPLHGAQIHKLILYLQKELGLSEDNLKRLLASPPRTLVEVPSLQEADRLQAELEKLGCFVVFDGLLSYDNVPFPIPRELAGTIQAELSKTLRCAGNLAFFSVQIKAEDPTVILPSMLGRLPVRIAGRLRDSDTVIGIDNNRLIILAFYTDRKGIPIVQNKIINALVEHVGENIRICIGVSLFPEDARTLKDLIVLSESNHLEWENNLYFTPEKPVHTPEDAETPTPAADPDDSSPLTDCLTKARGRIFQRLLNMSPRTLWPGLSQLSRARQRAFLDRMPYDCPLLPVLKRLIEAESKPAPDKRVGQHFEAIIHQMQMEEGLIERNKSQEEILSSLDRLEDLPTLPSVAMEIFEITSNPEFSVAELARVTMNDPALTSKLLKIVNSAFFGSQQKITSVQKAAVLLGSDEIVDITFGLAAAKVFDRPPIRGLIDPELLWHHSICTALIVRSLCTKKDEYETLGVFTAGLLHDMGKIFFMDNFPDSYREIQDDTARQQLPLFELEEDRMGINHALIGNFLSTKWNLPDSLSQAISFHHQPTVAPRYAKLAALVGFADYLYWQAAHRFRLPELDIFPPRLTFGHWRMLTQIFPGFNRARLQAMQKEAVEIIEKNGDLTR